MLESIGIVNSKTSYTANGGATETDEFYSNLGQPFYIDSLFSDVYFPAQRTGFSTAEARWYTS